MIITIDDLCLKYLDNFSILDEFKKKFKNLEVIAFTISNYHNEERISKSTLFKKWYEEHKKWVVIGVHSFDHLIPDGDKDDETEHIQKALKELKPFLPKYYAYRSPGFQTTNKTVPILKKLGFRYIFYETQVKDIKYNKIIEKEVINSHLYDEKSINRIYEILCRYN